MHICKGKDFSIFLASWFSWYLVLFLSFQPLRHYMRISIHTRKLFAQPFWLWKTLGPVTFSELQIQNLWGKLNTWHLQNKTENLLHLHSESWYLEVSDSLIISQQQYSPPRPHRVLPLCMCHSGDLLGLIWLSWRETAHCRFQQDLQESLTLEKQQ